MNNTISLLDVNTIELHYWLNDDSHLMDAHVFNKCEYEFLGIIQEVSSSLHIQVEVEVEPLGEGGIRAWLRLKESTKNQVKLAFLIYLCTDLICTPITTTLNIATTKALEYFFEDPEIRALEKEKNKAELEYDIAKIRKQTQLLCDSIDENKIKKKRSNYFQAASSCKKIDKISISLTDVHKSQPIIPREVPYVDFPKYIMTSDDVEPDCDENATIEIISPVLKKGRYMWVGIYKENVIQFQMKSNEFKTLVQTGQIPFKNGSSIQCYLLTKKKVNNEGEVRITGYEVLEVYNCFVSNTPIETPEGIRRRQKQEADKMQLDLFENI